MKPKRITFKVSVTVDKNGNFKIFGTDGYICCRETKECFLAALSFLIDEYGIALDDKLTENAMLIKNRIKDSVKVERIE